MRRRQGGMHPAGAPRGGADSPCQPAGADSPLSSGCDVQAAARLRFLPLPLTAPLCVGGGVDHRTALPVDTRRHAAGIDLPSGPRGARGGRRRRVQRTLPVSERVQLALARAAPVRGGAGEDGHARAERLRAHARGAATGARQLREAPACRAVLVLPAARARDSALSHRAAAGDRH